MSFLSSKNKIKESETSDDAILEKIGILLERKLEGFNAQLANDLHEIVRKIACQGDTSSEVQIIQEQEDKIMGLKDEIHRLETELHNLKRSGSNAAQDSRISTELEACRTQLADARNSIQLLESQLTSLSTENEQLKTTELSAQSEMSDTVRRLKEDLEAKEVELTQTFADLQDTTAKYSHLEQKHSCQMKEYEDILCDKEYQLINANASLAATEQEAAATLEKNKELQTELQDVKSMLTTEIERGQALSADVQQYKALYEQYARKCSEQEESLRGYEASLVEQNQRNHDLQGQYQALDAQYQMLEQEFTQSTAASQSEIAALKAECSKLQQCGAALEQQLQTLEVLRNRVFPECLSIPSLSTFVQEWRSQLLSPTPDPRILSMLANIFAWSCAKDAAANGGCDIPAVLLEKDAINGLSNFSRYFFDVLYAAGTSPDEAERLASDLMEKINAQLVDAGAKYEVVLPYSGEQFDSRTMVADTRGSRTGEVYQLRSMGIKSSTGDMMHSKSMVQLI